jgi:DNA polymerase III delta prime subunit
MFVNCCHGKGIKFIREDLKFFAKTNLQTNAGVKFKSIVLFNADSLTNDAQSALRRCIELFSYNTRFFIIVENKSKLLNPILSRFCEIYVPEYLENGKIMNLQQYVLNKKINTSSLEQIKKEFIQKIMEQVDLNTTYENLAEISTTIYEKGYSCLDLIEYFHLNSEKWSGEERAKIMMCFHKIKAEYRCEKLLMLYMLNFVFKGGVREPRELVDIGFL